jgi:hypothetical protein
VAAFGVEDDRLHVDPSLGLCVEAVDLEGADATRLACAPLAAAKGAEQ